jgi:hypothetical protein
MTAFCEPELSALSKAGAVGTELEGMFVSGDELGGGHFRTRVWFLSCRDWTRIVQGGLR